MSAHNRHLGGLRCALATSVVLLFAAAPTFLMAQTAQPAASGYVPTMADWLGVNEAIQRYRFGVEQHDQKAYESAFWDDGANIAVPSPGQEIRIPVKGEPEGPPPRRQAAGPSTAGPRDEVWHLPLSDYFHFESATRATHYEYFLSIYPQKEAKQAGKNATPELTRRSIVGWPGHYQDILEKRNGEWRILERKSFINQK